MKSVRINLRNCYGIGELECSFDFGQGPVHAVYAPNGVMKTSLAKTLSDAARGEESRDLMFPDRTTERSLTDSDGQEIASDRIFVIHPYEQDPETRRALLLVNPRQKRRYERAVKGVADAKRDLLGALSTRSGIRSRNHTVEDELLIAFPGEKLTDILPLLEKAADSADDDLAAVTYSVVFGEKAVAFLSKDGVPERLHAYVDRFESLVCESPILSPKFNHTEAVSVEKSLRSSGFFESGHSVLLNEGAETRTIEDPDSFESRIKQELDRVLDDPELRRLFDSVDKQLSRNVELRSLRDFLREQPHLLLRLEDLPKFRRQVWGAYLRAEASKLRQLREVFDAASENIRDVIREANEERTEWASVVEEFNARFATPFELVVENKADVVLKGEAPHVTFKFSDGSSSTSRVSRQDLLKVLSQGERRALYLLDIMFEARVRLDVNEPTLLIVDDIADSFDYRNKYAIIEYLHDLKNSKSFRMIVMSHNFDFHRSVSSRIGVRRPNRWVATRSERRVSLREEKYQKNPLNTWKRYLHLPEMFIAAIPMVRNLAELCGFEDVCLGLTNALHLKEKTMAMALADVDALFGQVISNFEAPKEPSRSQRLWDLIHGTAASLSELSSIESELESKVVLSVAIRLKAEEFMIGEIADPEFVRSITSDQTRRLLEKYRASATARDGALEVLGRVQLMTPENIHVNSFMYEPILDLGASHLRSLYLEVCGLNSDSSDAIG